MERVLSTELRPFMLVISANGDIVKSPKISQVTCDTERLLMESSHRYILAIPEDKGCNKRYYKISKAKAINIAGAKKVKEYETILSAMALRCAIYNVKSQLMAEYKDSAEYWDNVESLYPRIGNIKLCTVHINPNGSSHINEKENWFYDDVAKVIENQYDGDDWEF